MTTKTTNPAAEKYRLLQAQQLIESFRETVVQNGKPVEVPVFVLADPKTGAYKLNPLLAR